MKNLQHHFTKDNLYLGKCIVLTYIPSSTQIRKDSLTRGIIYGFINLPDHYKLPVEDYDLLDILAQEYPIDEEIPIRIASECFLGMFGDTHCDCEEQRLKSLVEIRSIGKGLYIHLPQEALGNGLVYKMSELGLQNTGHDQRGRYLGKHSQNEAAQRLTGNKNCDIRSYTSVHHLLGELNLSKHEYTFINTSVKKQMALLKDLYPEMHQII